MALGPYHAPYRGIFNRMMGLVKIYLYTKLEIFSFTRSIFLGRGSHNLKICLLTLTTLTVAVFFNREMGLAKIYLYTKFEGCSYLSVPNLWRGPKI